METILGKQWHRLTADEAIGLLDTDSRRGLDPVEAENRRSRFGANRLPERSGPGALRRLLQQFHQPLVYILVAAGGVTLFLREWVDAAVILGVVGLNALIGYLQEAKALQAITALARTMRTSATALRGGKRIELPSEALVPGDVVLLQSGDKVPADVRLVAARELRVDESALTGESAPVAKQAGPLPADTALAERRNMAYSSSLVAYGQATGVVVATGEATEIGRISHLIATAHDLQTPLTQRIAEFSRVRLWIILILAVATFLIGVARGAPASEMFLSAVALAVGAIPEGLPAAVTITLAIGVARMAGRRAVIRKLPAVETLGGATVVCSDKTGTLTENQMTVREIWAGGETFQVTGEGCLPGGEVTCDGRPVALRDAFALQACLKAGALCNEAQLRFDQEKKRRFVQGDPTEGALLVVAEKAGLGVDRLRTVDSLVDAVPFESQHQFMATLHRTNDGFFAEQPPSARRVLYLKGAVEKVIERCDSMLDALGARRPFDKTLAAEAAEKMAAQGLRVLAIAGLEFAGDRDQISAEDLDSGLTFLGLQGMIDPPRAEAIAAVYTCRTAGVKVKMITGDHAATARAIAEQIGVLSEPSSRQAPPPVYTGAQLAALSDDELVRVAEQVDVFARVTPEQKLRLVRALQANGHVVAMTGDGVNDGPALRQANIGVAMGLGGTEVAKEAADVVLTDDNFATIEAAIEEGRGVFDNLTKFIVWTLPTNLGEGMVILVAILFGATLPILPLQILWINLTTSVLLGLTLAFEPKEQGIMLRPPRDPRQPILTNELLTRIVLVGTLLLIASFGLFEWSLHRGATAETARTIAVSVFVFGEAFYLLNCRSLRDSLLTVGLFTNGWLWLGVLAMTAMQLLFVYHPAMNRLFQSAPLDRGDWQAILLASLAIYMTIGFEKWLRRRRPVGVASAAPGRVEVKQREGAADVAASRSAAAVDFEATRPPMLASEHEIEK